MNPEQRRMRAGRVGTRARVHTVFARAEDAGKTSCFRREPAVRPAWTATKFTRATFMTPVAKISVSASADSRALRFTIGSEASLWRKVLFVHAVCACDDYVIRVGSQDERGMPMKIIEAGIFCVAALGFSLSAASAPAVERLPASRVASSPHRRRPSASSSMKPSNWPSPGSS